MSLRDAAVMHSLAVVPILEYTDLFPMTEHGSDRWSRHTSANKQWQSHVQLTWCIEPPKTKISHFKTLECTAFRLKFSRFSMAVHHLSLGASSAPTNKSGMKHVLKFSKFNTHQDLYMVGRYDDDEDTFSPEEPDHGDNCRSWRCLKYGWLGIHHQVVV